MHRQSKLPVKLWLVLLGAILITAGMTSVSLAKTETLFHGTHNFIILQATNTTAYFTIDNDCDDIDKNCTVFVRRNIHFDPSGDDGFEDEWKAEIDGGNTGIVGCSMDGTGESGRNRDFELCWEAVERGGNPGLEFTIEWPSINPDDDFEVTPYCKRGDDVCAAELRVCYNANDCDGNSYGRQSWTEVGELWDEAGSCLYDDDEDEVWECLDEALDDWLDDNMDHDDDYGDLEDEEEEDRGFTLEDYEDDLSSVGRDWATPRRAENGSARSPRQETSRTPTTVYQPRTSVDTRQSGSRLTGNEYLTVNFTAYLEAEAPYQVCNTIIGCVTVATLSNTFWPNTQNLHIVIQDAGGPELHGRVRLGCGQQSRHFLRQYPPDRLRRPHQNSQSSLSGQGHRCQRRPVLHVGHRSPEGPSPRLVCPRPAPAGGTGPRSDPGLPVHLGVR